MEYKNKSKNYKRLIDLMESGCKIACWVDMYETSRDICEARYYKDSHFSYTAQARGIQYLIAKTKQEFIELCVQNSLEFLDPEPPKCETCKYESNDCGWCQNDKVYEHLENTDEYEEQGKQFYLNPKYSFGCRFHQPKESEDK